MVLTDKQRADLHKAVLGFLVQSGFEQAATAFSEEAGVSRSEVGAKEQELLERKWTAIVRLQRKVMMLEQTVASQQEDLKGYAGGKRFDRSEALPREPARVVVEGHRGAITAVAFHPMYSLVVSSSEDASVKVWDTDSGALERTLKGHTDAVQDVCFNQDGSVLASCSADLSIRLWNFEKGLCVRTLTGHDHSVSSVRFLPGGNQALMSGSRDKTAKLWDTQSGYCTRTFSDHDQWVRCVRLSPDGAVMATASNDQTVKVWNVLTGECLRTLRDHDHVVETVEITDNTVAEAYLRAIQQGVEAPSSSGGKKDEEKAAAAGAFVITGCRDKKVRIFDTATGELVRELEGHGSWVRGIVVHPSGKYLLTCGDDKRIIVWDLSKNLRLSRKIDSAHPLFVSCIAWCRSQPLLASGGVDNSVRIWECR